MQDRVLVSATVITDDSTGNYTVGDFDFSVPGWTGDWLDADPKRPKALADWLRWLADQCEKRETPFFPHNKVVRLSLAPPIPTQ